MIKGELMKESRTSGTKGVALSIDGQITAYILFPTAPGSSTDKYGIKDAESCLVISSGYLIYANAFCSHVWMHKSQHHKYKFTFNSGSHENLEKLCGELEYEYVEGDESSDSSSWKNTSADGAVIDCFPLKMKTFGMWRYTDNGQIDLHFQFPTLEHPFTK